MKQKLILVFFLFVSFTGGLTAQPFNQKGTFMVSTNPLKLIYGIINIEIEYQLTPAFSLELGSEYVIGHYIVKKDAHPDFSIRVGPRYHIFHKKDFGGNNDLYIGTYAGYTSSNTVSEFTSFNAGAEAGYKYRFDIPLFIHPKILLTYPFSDPAVIPGFECLFGYVAEF